MYQGIPKVISNYQLIEELGRGGMGVVYKAVEKQGRIVAIKFILEQNEKSKKRFFREFKLMAKLSHKNIVQIYNAGEMNQQLYFVMEYVEGTSLNTIIEKEALSFDEIKKITLQVAEALAYAHKQNIIHRDIKPSNILIEKDGNVKIMDFGLARSITSEECDLTQAGVIIGSLRYLAPEQLTGKLKLISPQIDVYALGTVFHEMITRKPMITGTSEYQILLNIKAYKAEKLHHPSMNQNLQAVWEKSIARKRMRYLSMQLFLNDLQNAFLNKKTSISSTQVNKGFFRLSLFFIFLLLTSFVIFNFSFSKEEKTNQYFHGIIEFDNKNYLNAQKIFTLLPNKQSYLMLPYYLGATIYHLEKQQQNITTANINIAIQKLQEVANKFPYNSEVPEVIAKCYLLIKNYNVAKEYFQKCILLVPDESEYYRYIAEINLEQKEYNACLVNLKKALALQQTNVKAMTLLLHLSIKAPSLQAASWRLLDHVVTSLKPVKPPILFRAHFEYLQRSTHKNYILANESGINDESFYVHIAIKAYLEGKNTHAALLEQGKETFLSIVENLQENIFVRYIAAKALVLLNEFELLADFRKKTSDIIGQAIVFCTLREAQIPIQLTQNILDILLKSKNIFSIEEQEFLELLLSQSLYINNQEYPEVVSIEKKYEEVLLAFMNSKNEKVKLAAASNSINILNLSYENLQKAFSILDGIRHHKDKNLRMYSYYHILNSYHSQYPFDYQKIYKEGLRDSDPDVNILCLSFFYKFVQVILPENPLYIFSPDPRMGIKIKNKDFVLEIKDELYKLTKSSHAELAFMSICIWAISIERVEELLYFLENNHSNTLTSYISIRMFLMVNLIENVQSFWQSGRLKDIDKILPCIIAHQDQVLQGNIYFFLNIFTFTNIIEEMGQAARIGVFNGCGLNITLRVIQVRRQEIISILESHLAKASILEKEAIYTSLFYLQSNYPRQKIYNTMLKSDDEPARLGISEALYRDIRIELIPIEEEIKDRFWYLKVYNPYRLEEVYEAYRYKLLSLKNSQKNNIIKKFDDIIALHKENPDYYYERALLYIVDNDFAQAQQNLEKSIFLLPENTRYIVTLAEVEYHNGNIEHCKELLAEIETKEQNYIILEKIATLYYKMNMYKKAIDIYKKLFSQKPYNKEYTLSIIYLYCKELDIINALLYSNWLKAISKHKYLNTKDVNDLFTKEDFSKEEFQLIYDDVW